MDNGYVIAFVVVAAISIGILRYRNRDALQQAERNERLPWPSAERGKDGEAAQEMHMAMDIRAREGVDQEPGRRREQTTHADARDQP